MRRLLLLWRVGRQDLRLLWFAVRHPSRPVWLLPTTALLGFIALQPLNFAVPLVGVVDDFVILPLVLHALLSFLPIEVRAGFDRDGGRRTDWLPDSGSTYRVRRVEGDRRRTECDVRRMGRPSSDSDNFRGSHPSAASRYP